MKGVILIYNLEKPYLGLENQKWAAVLGGGGGERRGGIGTTTVLWELGLVCDRVRKS